MATRTVSTRNLVGRTSLSFIRSQVVNFVASGTKPSTRLYAFFDGVSVDAYVTPSGGSMGGVLTTDTAGRVAGSFTIPGMTFNTGDREFKLQDSDTYQPSSVPGSLAGSATSTFTANGMKETYQTTINTVFQIVIQEPGQPSGSGDPLAQSFFTYGVTGGCFITKIDLYFQSKDASIPVTVELREMSNGYPAATRVSKQSVVTLAPSAVNVSANASVPTTFSFSRPVYLEENKDYCFVILANSNAYHMWTSKLGEVSVENGKTIFEQPFIGSMFKSENNITWSAEQTEDIKFTLYKANFATGTADVTFKAVANSVLIPGTSFSVTNGSPVVTAVFDFEHGQNTGDKLVLSGNGNAYRGISDSTISAPAGFSVTRVDATTLTFSVGTNATSTGTLAASGQLKFVDVDASGSGYVAPSISFSGGGGTGAAATATVVGGKITSVTVTNPGSGYTSTPTLTVTDASGSGAVLVPVTDAIFGVAINRPYQAVYPYIAAMAPESTTITNTIRTSDVNYVVGTHVDAPINTPTNVGKLAAVVNSLVETTSFGSNDSTQMITRLTSSNPNISPMIDMSEGPAVRLFNFKVNGASNSTSELTHATGTAQARYLSKPVTVATVSKDIRVLVEAASVANTSFDVFVRTSVSGATAKHTDENWTKLVCTTPTNLSGTLEEFKDYEFRTSANLTPFDVYDIKIVLYSEAKYNFPRINNYRAVVLAT